MARHRCGRRRATPAGEAPEPKCNHISARSMEIFRRLGVATKLRNIGLPEDYPNDVSYRTTCTGIEFARIHIPCRRDRYTDKSGPDGHWPTPEPPHRINQIFLEPVLFAHAAAHAARAHPEPLLRSTASRRTSRGVTAPRAISTRGETDPHRLPLSRRLRRRQVDRAPGDRRAARGRRRACSACRRPTSARPT